MLTLTIILFLFIAALRIGLFFYELNAGLCYHVRYVLEEIPRSKETLKDIAGATYLRLEEHVAIGVIGKNVYLAVNGRQIILNKREKKLIRKAIQNLSSERLEQNAYR